MTKESNKKDNDRIGKQHAELPRQDYYTLEQAADELNIFFNRNDIDGDYFIHLAEVGRIKLFLPLFGKDLLCALPHNFDETIQDLTTKEKIIADLNRLLKSRTLRNFIGLSSQNVMELSTLNELNLCTFMDLRIYDFKQQDDLKLTPVSRVVDLPQYMRLIFAFRKPQDGFDRSRVSSFSESEVVDFSQLNTLWDEITLTKNMLCIFDSTLQRIKDGNVPSYYEVVNSEQLRSSPADEILENNELSSLDVFNQRKADLKAMARVMAAYEWTKFGQQDMKMMDMAALIKGMVEPYARTNEMPKHSNAVADWIREIAPDYAKKGGRPPTKK